MGTACRGGDPTRGYSREETFRGLLIDGHVGVSDLLEHSTVQFFDKSSYRSEDCTQQRLGEDCAEVEEIATGPQGNTDRVICRSVSLFEPVEDVQRHHMKMHMPPSV